MFNIFKRKEEEEIFPINNNLCFRSINHIKKINDKELYKLFISHIINGILSLNEINKNKLGFKPKVSYVNENYISVISGTKDIEYMGEEYSFNDILKGTDYKIGLIIDSIHQVNKFGSDALCTNHSIIDATIINIKERQIIGIIINTKKISKKLIAKINNISEKNNLPLYYFDNVYITKKKTN